MKFHLCFVLHFAFPLGSNLVNERKEKVCDEDFNGNAVRRLGEGGSKRSRNRDVAKVRAEQLSKLSARGMKDSWR